MLNDVLKSIIWSGSLWQQCKEDNRTLISMVSDDVYHKVPQHWHSFTAPHPLWQPILGTLYIIIGLMSVTGNTLVLWIFGTTRNLQSGTNMLTMNLAASDLGMMVTQFPVLVANCYNQKWTLGPTACEIYGFCGALFGTVSIITLSLIAIDRYYAITDPFVGWRLSQGKAWLWILGTWFYGTIWCVPPILGWNQYVLEGFLTSCSFDYLSDDPWTRGYVYFLMVGAYILPLTIIIACYGFIYASVHQHNHRMKSKEDSKESRVSKSIQRRERQLARVVILSVIFWTIAWTPYAVVSMMGVFSWTVYLTPLCTMLPALFAKLSTVYNPFIYAVSHPRYRKELANRVPWLCCSYTEEFVKTAFNQHSTVSKTHTSNQSQISRCDDSRNNSMISYGPSQRSNDTRASYVRRTSRNYSIDSAYIARLEGMATVSSWKGEELCSTESENAQLTSIDQPN